MAADQHNSVTIFSNGQAHIRRYVKVEPAKVNEISLPFRKTSMEDVLASIGVFNPHVRYARPASFAIPGKSSLTLGSTTFDTIASLRGAKIRCKRGNATIEGTIFGTDALQEIGSNGQTINRRYLTIQTGTGLTTVPWQEVLDLVFTEDEIVAEVNKALAASRQKLKPDSVFLNLALATKQEKEELALIQWVEQLVPWKLAYRLTRKENGTTYQLDTFGIAHNNTETDWQDCLICLVNGKPMTFVSDLDQAREVRRQHVNVTESTAKGGFIPEGGIPTCDGPSSSDHLEGARGGARAQVLHNMAPAAAPAPSYSNVLGSQLMQHGQASFPAQVATEDVGDFMIYRQEHPMTIAANSAAAIPLNSVELKGSKPVLIYDHRYSETRPFRAISFLNETKQSLGTGVCVVFERGSFQGKAIMLSSKPTEKRMILYAEETGVHVTRKSYTAEPLPRRLKVHEGAVIWATLHTSKTTYTLGNVKSEPFDTLVEYHRTLNETSKITVTGGNAKVAEEVQHGYRFAVTVPAQGSVTFTVFEEFTGTQTYEMSDANWFLNTFIVTDEAIRQDKSIAQIISQTEVIEKKKQAVAACQTKINKAVSTKNHLTQILALGDNAGNIQQYQGDLQKAMAAIKESEEAKETAETAVQAAQEKLYGLLKKLSGEWTYQDEGKDEPHEQVAEPAAK